MLLEKEMGSSRARAVIHYGQALPSIQGAEAHLIKDVMHLPIGERAVMALLQVERMVSDVRVGSATKTSWQSGRISGTAAY